MISCVQRNEVYTPITDKSVQAEVHFGDPLPKTSHKNIHVKYEKNLQSVKAVPRGILRYGVFIKHRARFVSKKMPTEPEASPPHIRNVVAGKLVHKINLSNPSTSGLNLPFLT